jgi:hypothetical protein
MSSLNIEPGAKVAGRVPACLSACFVCGVLLADMKQLQRHLLIGHASQHFCLFCVETKSWSDEFVSQAAYHAHYNTHHSGLVESRRRERQEARRQEAERRREELNNSRQRRAQQKLFQGDQPLILQRSLRGRDG